MITDRDREIINYIYEIGFATIDQVSDMYFTNLKSGYDLARRRLKRIKETSDYLRVVKNNETNQLIYIPTESNIKRVSMHNIKVIDYLCKLKKIGCEIERVEIEHDFNGIIPDAYVSLIFDGYRFHQLIEVQIRHDYVDINRYNKCMDSILDTTGNVIPTLVIIQNTNKNYSNENKTQMDIKQMDLNMDDVAKVLC